MKRMLSDCPVIPRTYREFNKLHLNSYRSQLIFGKTFGTALKSIKPQRYEDIFKGWKNYAESKAKNPYEEWYAYLANYLIYGVLPEEYTCYDFKNLNDGKKESTLRI